VKRLVADLGADSFPTREKASAELAKLRLHAAPALTEASARHSNPEVRRRADAVLTELRKAGVAYPTHGLSAEPLRQVRAVAVLERIGGAEARKLLEGLREAGGPPGEEAVRALARMPAD
jgi:hypothetical protein